MEGQRRTRAGLVEERNREAGRQPSRRNAPQWPPEGAAELVGADTDTERAIRLLIAVMVLCCDPLAIVLTAAASLR